ncbi:MAG: D-alanine--D-alanine ligase family protein [candidate division KSB1 bacterium]|nr:D-alanine--D-alanine ligase family protein [candidate division KSB1 bacterium]
MSLLNIAVLVGGRSTEHQVSLVSGQSVISALNKEKYNVIPVGISKSGQWLYGDRVIEYMKSGKGEPPAQVYPAIDPEHPRIFTDDQSVSLPIDVVFPALHGTYGEDGTVQGLLECMNVPYVGAGVLGSSLCMDKIWQKQICRQSGLPVPDYLWFYKQDWQEKSANSDQLLQGQVVCPSHADYCRAVEEHLGYPVFVKPAGLGSSVGISRAHDRNTLLTAVDTAIRFDEKILIEAAVPNVREIEVAVLGNLRPRASVPGEVVPSNEFYDYNAKYVDNASVLNIPAPLDQNLQTQIQQTAVKSFLAADTRGMARVDFLLNAKTGAYYLNELNTIPGFTEISMYAKLWDASGIPYQTLLDHLIDLAVERHRTRRDLQVNYTPKTDWFKE